MNVRALVVTFATLGLCMSPAFAQGDPHTGHTMRAAQATASTTAARNANLPPDADAAKDQLATSPRHGEWVDIKMANGPAIKSFVVYPERSTTAPVVIVIHEIFGMATGCAVRPISSPGKGSSRWRPTSSLDSVA